jgi:hypothetical protein
MSTVMADIKTLMTKMGKILNFAKWIWSIFSKLKFAKQTIDVVAPVATKIGIFTKISYFISPRAKLTYWLADEEVVVYVSDFKQKDQFKLIFKELETGRLVMVNGATPINYRLEELKPTDHIEKTHIEQNQHF